MESTVTTDSVGRTVLSKPLEAQALQRGFIRLLLSTYLLLLFFGFSDPVLTIFESLVGISFFLCIVASCLKTDGAHIRLPLPFAIAFGFLLYCLVVLLYSEVRSGSGSELDQYRRLTTMMISICVSYGIYLYLVTSRDFNYLLLVIYLCLFGTALLVITGQTVGSGNENRISGGLGSPNQFSSSFGIMSALLLVPFAKVLSRRLGGTAVVSGIFFVFLVGLALNIFYTGSRQGMLISAFLLLIATLFSLSRMVRRPSVFIIFLGLGAIGFAFSAAGAIDLSYNFYVMRLLNLFSYFNETTLVVRENSLFERAKMIETGLELWQRSPVIGHGIGSFKHMSGFKSYSHNNFVEVLVAGGVVGLGIYLTAHLIILRRIAMDRDIPRIVRAAGSLAVLLLLASGLTIVTYYSRVHWIAFGVLAAASHSHWIRTNNLVK